MKDSLDSELSFICICCVRILIILGDMVQNRKKGNCVPPDKYDCDCGGGSGFFGSGFFGTEICSLIAFI